MMFRTAELGRTVSKEDFEALAPALRIEIVDLQQRLRRAKKAVVIVFAGVDGAGKSESLNLLNEWMDPRWLETHAYGPLSDEEAERPAFWRYWRDMPAAGKIGLFLNSWYSEPMSDHVHGRIDDADLDTRLARIAAFESMLAADGVMILKFWMHLAKDVQKKRLKKLEADPLQAWRVSKQDWKHWRRYDAMIATAEHSLRATNTVEAPWVLVEGADPIYRTLTVLTTVRDAALRCLQESKKAEKKAVSEPAIALPPQPTILSALDLSQKLSDAEYQDRLTRVRARLSPLFRAAKEKKISTVLAFEGFDAAGKGGSIRRLTAGLDAREYQVIPISAPSPEEQAHPYLWRFWRHLSRAGRLTVFDRTWYGRVLVERVEGFASPDDWGRAYNEIAAFEEQLLDAGMILGKFWLHISADEQLKRFLERQNIPWKTWKLTDDDWRNRDKRAGYQEAVNAMIERTSTRRAPWTLVEADDKNFTRIKIMETVASLVEKRLDHHP